MSDNTAAIAAASVSPSPLPSYETWAFYKARPTIIIPIPTLGASGLILSRPGILCGLALRETAGAAAVFDLVDGLDNLADTGMPISLAANGQMQLNVGADGPFFVRGFYLNRTSGSIKGALWVKV